jgi:Mn2+/Fe2+ NRAMP family transporter
VGIGVGSLLFAVVYPLIEGFYNASAMGVVTLPQLLDVNHWVVLVFVFAFAGFMFYLMERYEKKSR